MKNALEVKLGMVTEVNDFVKKCNTFEEDIIITSGRFIINAKSLMGVYSLDLSKAITVTIDTDNLISIDKFCDELKPYVV